MTQKLQPEEKIKQLELQLQIEQKKTDMMSEYLKCSLWEYDIKSKCLFHNRSLNGVWKDFPNTIPDFPNTILERKIIHPDDRFVFAELCNRMNKGDQSFKFEIRALGDDGKFKWIRYTALSVHYENGQPIKLTGKVDNIDEEVKRYDEFSNQIEKDALTQLWNFDVASKVLYNQIKSNPKEKGVLILFDLDHFKDIYRKWGHLYGDSIVESFANILLACFSRNDILCRMDGDQFLVYCTSVSNNVRINQLLDMILSKTRNIIMKEGVCVTVSAGIAFSAIDATSFHELYYYADLALSKAKKDGRDQYCFYNEKLQGQIKMGESTRKKKQKNETILTRNEKKIEKELFDFCFETISGKADFEDAISILLNEIGLYYNLDSVYIALFNQHKEQIKILSSWQRNEKIQYNMSIELELNNNWHQMNERYDKKSVYICNVKDETNGNVKAIIEFPIFDGDTINGVVNYEVTMEKQEWTSTQIDSLASITKMLSSYILRVRNKDEFRLESIYTTEAMNSQKLIYYAIDSHTNEIQYVSKFTKQQYPNISIGDKCYKAIMKKDRPCQKCPLQGLEKGRDNNSIEVYDENEDVWYLYRVSTIRKDDKIQYLLLRSDVTTFLERVKKTDQLTGTMSGDRFGAAALKKLCSKNKKYAIASIGIQQFARINDEYGYAIGDVILKMLAKCLKESLLDDDIVSRLKGDDFVVLYENNHLESLKERIYTLFDNFSLMVNEEYLGIDINCICGIYLINEEDFYISEILDKANLAKQYSLNLIGKKHIIFVLTEELEKKELEEKDIQRRLREAIKNNEFCVYVQPKVNLFTGKIGGGEALIRWFTSDGKVIPPGLFIPIAEKSGMVVQLDNFVYETIFQMIRKWLDQGKKVPIISLNVTKADLFQKDFIEYMDQLTKKYNVPSKYIELEIVETIFSRHPEHLKELVMRLKNLGFWVSMDDFGTGYSSLSMMKHLPVDILKIDGSFFKNSELDERNKAILDSIIHLAQSLQIKIVCEGIETKEQLDYIIQEQCNYAQGYYYYKPMPILDFEEMLINK